MKKLSISHAARSVFFMLAVFVTFGLIFTTTSCKQDQVAPIVSTTPTAKTLKMSGVSEVKGKFTVQDGILHFENPDAFVEVFRELRKYDVSERRNFGHNFGFKSMLSSYCDVLIKGRDIEDMDAYDTIIDQNRDIMVRKPNGAVDFKIDNWMLACVLNRDGIMYIGKSIYKFTDFGEIIILDGDSSRLSTVTKNTPTDKNIKVIIDKEEIGLRAFCGPTYFGQQVSGERMGRLETSRQKIQIFMGADPNGIFLYQLLNFSTGKGTPFKQKCNIFGGNCRFVQYLTNNTLTIKHTLESYNGTCPYSDDFTYSNHWDFIDYGGSECRTPSVTEAEISQYYPYLTSENSLFNMTNTSVVVQFNCN